MSVFTPVGILVFSMLIVSLLQLVPGVFLIFRHYTAGRFSRHKASDLSIFFIIGAETFTATVLLSLYFIFSSLFSPLTLNNQIFAWIIAGILVTLGLFFFFCYFRKSSGTRLFISRQTAHNYLTQAKTAKSRSDAFLFGISALLPELVFTLPLYLLSALAIIQLGTTTPLRTGLIIIFALIAIAPLLIIHGLSRTHTSADFIRFRFKNKTFFRFFIPLLYFLTAILIILGV